MKLGPSPVRPDPRRCTHSNGCGHHTPPGGAPVWHMGIPGIGQASMRDAAQRAADESLKAQVLRWRPREDRDDELVGPSLAALQRAGAV